MPRAHIYAIALLAAFFASNAHAAFMVFQDRNQFLAATSNMTLIDFGGIAPNRNAVAFNTSAGLSLSGANFVGVNSFGNNEMYVIDDDFCCTQYQARGGNVASLSTPVTRPVGEESRVVITMPSGVTAVGMDLFSVVVGDDAVGGETDTVRIRLGGETFFVQTVPAVTGDNAPPGSGRVFFGVLSETQIDVLSILPTRRDRQTAADIVDFTFGVAVVPLPGGAWLMISALLGITSLCRVQRRA